MFKKITLLFFVAIFAACIGYVAAQDYPQDKPATEAQTPEMGQIQHVSGLVEKIDLQKKTITLKDAVSNKSKEFTFDAATLFSKGTAPTTANDLKKGDKVAVEVNAQSMISSVRITPEIQKEKN